LTNPAKEIVRYSPVDASTSLSRWEAEIKGPMNTPYANGLFVLDINFPQEYPIKPPKIIFITKVFHPNISSKGEICLDILQDKYTPCLDLEKILISIVLLLSDPNPDHCLAPVAAVLYKYDREEFDKKAKEWTRQYAMPVCDPPEVQKNSTEVSSLHYSQTKSLQGILSRSKILFYSRNFSCQRKYAFKTILDCLLYISL
jgi:ubiquitin-conjugating enzyme E2 D/E